MLRVIHDGYILELKRHPTIWQPYNIANTVEAFFHVSHKINQMTVDRNSLIKASYSNILQSFVYVEIPGCPAPNHGAFLTQLVGLLAREMASAGGSLPAELTNSANMSLEEKAIRWKVITADRDGDKVNIYLIYSA